MYEENNSTPMTVGMLKELLDEYPEDLIITISFDTDDRDYTIPLKLEDEPEVRDSFVTAVPHMLNLDIGNLDQFIEMDDDELESVLEDLD